MQVIPYLMLCIVGLGSGIVVGSGFIAFITVLDIVPRATQMTKTQSYLPYYQVMLGIGAVVGSILPGLSITFRLPAYVIGFIGGLMGIYIGFFVAALTEVVNVLPVLARRLRVKMYVAYLLTFLAVGKVFGSLIYWVFPHLWQY